MSDFGLARPITGVDQVYVKSNRVGIVSYYSRQIMTIIRKFALGLTMIKLQTALIIYYSTFCTTISRQMTEYIN